MCFFEFFQRSPHQSVWPAADITCLSPTTPPCPKGSPCSTSWMVFEPYQWDFHHLKRNYPPKPMVKRLDFSPLKSPLKSHEIYIKPYEIWLKSNKIVPKLGNVKPPFSLLKSSHFLGFIWAFIRAPAFSCVPFQNGLQHPGVFTQPQRIRPLRWFKKNLKYQWNIKYPVPVKTGWSLHYLRSSFNGERCGGGNYVFATISNASADTFSSTLIIQPTYFNFLFTSSGSHVLSPSKHEVDQIPPKNLHNSTTQRNSVSFSVRNRGCVNGKSPSGSFDKNNDMRSDEFKTGGWCWPQQNSDT